MLNDLKHFFEKQFFGVCAWWAKKLGVRPFLVRLFFIYLSFMNFGIPLLYLIMVFVFRIRNHFKYRKRPSVFDI